jgi:beta-N-acetylhexosaminidase
LPTTPRSRPALLLWISSLAALGCVRGMTQPLEPVLPDPPRPPAAVTAVDPRAAEQEMQLAALLDALTLEQKVGQLMMVGFAGTEVDESVRALVKGRQVGGVCLFRRNIEDAAQVARLNAALGQLLAGAIPPLIAVDQEGGSVVRVPRGSLVLPGNMALAATRSAALAYSAGKAQAEDLALLGFNTNLAPVLDVNLNPRNPVIGVRSFGDRPELVSEFGADFIRGQQDANMVTIAKHFPGHGDTDADSHLVLPVMDATEAQVLAQLEPFRVAIAGGLDGMMTAHVAIPRMTGDDLPATLSPRLLTGLLREKMGYSGLVITDELEMEAIAQRFGVGRAAVMAVQAGADMVLIPWRPEKKTEVHQALLAAARSGELSPQRLDGAVRSILRTKLRRGLFHTPRPPSDRDDGLGERQQIAEQIAHHSVTLLRLDEHTFPLRGGRRVGVVTAEPELGRAIRRRVQGAVVMSVQPFSTPAQRAKDRARAIRLFARPQVEVVVVGVVNSRQLELVTLAAASGKPVVVVTMGLPYLAEEMDEARTVLALYGTREVSAEAGAAALFGEKGTPGRLPVSLPSFPFGHGLNPVGERGALGSSGGR